MGRCGEKKRKKVDALNPRKGIRNMKNLFFFGIAIILLSRGAAMSQSLYDFTMNDIDGKPVPLREFEGKVAVVVNVASKCGFTPQYRGLEELYNRYKDRGLVVLGFPANNFFFQEPGTDAEIKQFCSLKYNVTFPMFSKISVKGKNMAPLYRWLTGQKTVPEGPGAVTWNFNKFLVNRGGLAVYRFGSKTIPLSDELIRAVETLLAEPAPVQK
jgi:glutathione peroxidase-family protein